MVKEREVLQSDRCLISGKRRMFDLVHSEAFAVGEGYAKNALLSTPMIFKDAKMFLQNNIYEVS